MSLYEQLMQSFPEEDVAPFGCCLVVPLQAFREEWRTKLTEENVSVFSQAYNGKTVFLLKRKGNNQTAEKLKLPELKPLEWSERIIADIRRMREQGLSFQQITQILHSRGFQIKPSTLHVKFWRLTKKAQQQQTSVKAEDKNADCEVADSLFFEFIEAAKILYPYAKFKNACAFLLKKASETLERPGV